MNTSQQKLLDAASTFSKEVDLAFQDIETTVSRLKTLESSPETRQIAIQLANDLVGWASVFHGIAEKVTKWANQILQFAQEVKDVK